MDRISRLGYAKTEGARGRWCLVVNHYERRWANDDPRDIDLTFVKRESLLQASRDLRLAAVEELPKLMDLIARTAKQKLAAVRKVTDKQ